MQIVIGDVYLGVAKRARLVGHACFSPQKSVDPPIKHLLLQF